MLPDALARYLSQYVAVEGSRALAARSFVRSEDESEIRNLLRAIRELFRDDPPEQALKGEIEREANTNLRGSARAFLLELFSAIAREASFGREIKAYDAFISYSSQDSELAAWLASELRRQGYAVWLDRDEILVGHSILDEVYRGILQSQFLIVLLTRQSLNSRWVHEELSAARVQEIEDARVVLLPAKCEAGIAIPPPLRGKRYADLSTSRDGGLREIIQAIDFHRGGAPTPVGGGEPSATATLQALRAWYSGVSNEPAQAGYNPDQGGYKDFVVGPPDGVNLAVEKRALPGLLDRARVRLAGWGGAPFPYQENPRAQVANVADGMRLVDTATWPYSAWNFNYWRFTDSLRFFQRSGLLEDGVQGPSGEFAMKGMLSIVWVLKDVCSLLRFAANLQRE